MAEQLNFNLGLNASPMIQAATQATQQLEQKFKQAGNNIRTELEKPATMQLELNVTGDPRKAYRDTQAAQKEVLRNQKQINQSAKAREKLQNKVTKAVKGTVQEKKAALKLVERLMKGTGRTAEEMKVLARYAKELKQNLPKDLPSPGDGAKGMEAGFLKANIGATALTRTVDMLAQSLQSVISTGVQMQSLNLQMEAFTGSASNADAAMASFADIASRSPLNVMEVAEAGKIMMAFGVETREAGEATEMLAIAAAASGGDINMMSRNLGQIQAQQRAYTRDLTQFAIQGVPIWENLAEVTGASVAELKDMAKDGKIGMESVMAALRNMTKEGTAFREVANRMQETYAGKLAKVESSFQTASGQIIESISDIDDALGGISTTLTDQVIMAIDRTEQAFEDMATVAKAVNFVLGDFFPPQTNDRIKQLTDEIGKKLPSAFLSLIPGVGSLTNGLDNFAVGLNGTAIGIEQLIPAFSGMNQQANDLSMSTEDLKQKLRELGTQTGDPNLLSGFQSMAAEAEQYRRELNSLIRDQMKLSKVTKQTINGAIAEYARLKDQAQEKLKDIEIAHQKQADAAVEAYNRQKTADEELIASKEQVISALDAQIAKTRELGPAGEKLEAIRRRELEYTAKTGKTLEGHITAEQRKKLEAQAALERLDAQAKAAELQKQKLKEQNSIKMIKQQMEERELQHTEEMNRLEDAKKQNLVAQNDLIKKLQRSIDQLGWALKGDLVGGWDELKKLIGKAEAETGDVTAATAGYNSQIDNTIKKYVDINTQLDKMAIKIRNMPKLQTGAPNAFSGGPVSGGDMRTVNELGKEAFLSASGKLSMINAPAWGEWRAPSAGTIIPAHLTKQLDIPTGGINLNKAPGGLGSAAMVAKVVQQPGGDVFHQNVTVQAANPVQAANNMMVEMTRLRRRRFG